jgi:hypothetical protein
MCSAVKAILNLTQSWHIDHRGSRNVSTIFNSQPDIGITFMTLEAHIGTTSSRGLLEGGICGNCARYFLVPSREPQHIKSRHGRNGDIQIAH